MAENKIVFNMFKLPKQFGQYNKQQAAAL